MRVRTSSNEPLDFCRFCRPSEARAVREYSDPAKAGPDGRGDCFAFDDDHPEYEGADVRCVTCGWELTNED